MSDVVRLVVNIEGNYGLSTPEQYIEHIRDVLGVDSDKVKIVNKYNDSYYWIIDDVDVSIYNDRVDELQKYYMGLHTKGLIHYFYMSTL